MSETAIFRRDPISHFSWLEFPEKPDEATRQLLKTHGWRYSRYRMQWYTNRRFALPPEGISYVDGGECFYAEERSERLKERAERAEQQASAASIRARKIADVIPPGQPILVGHHSERGHRRDLEWIDNAMRKSIEASNKAQRLQEKAEGSRAHQRHLRTPGAIYRRLERLRKEQRDAERLIAKIEADTQESAVLAEYKRRRELLAEEIGQLEQALQEAGGIPADSLNVEKGDTVLIGGHVMVVRRVNRKTFTCEDTQVTYADGSPWVLTLDRSELQKIIKKAEQKPEEKASRKPRRRSQKRKSEGMNRCPSGCTEQGPSQDCPEGLRIYDRLVSVTNTALSKAFVESTPEQRREVWTMWNQCAQRYLTHIHFGAPPINYRQLSRDYKASKYCEACQQRTTWILWYHPLEGTVLSCGSCREREDVRIAALAWKLSILKTDSNVKVLEMVMQWIKQRRSFPDLINEIQKARETYAPGTQEWKALDAACGVVQADHEACLIEDEEMGRR